MQVVNILRHFISIVIILSLGILTALYVTKNTMRHRRTEFLSSKEGIPIKSLLNIANQLHSFYMKYGSYPKSSTGYDGFISCYGVSKEDWIPGLVPEYLPVLPRDPRKSSNCSKQFFYHSDGVTYDLVYHNVDNIFHILSLFPEMADPSRIEYAIKITDQTILLDEAQN